MPPKATDLLTEIERLLPTCSAGQARIARFVLQSPDEAQHISLAQLCKRCKTSEPVVFAFCSLLQCGGYREFKMRLAENLGARRARGTPQPKIQDEALTEQSHPGSILTAIADQYRRSIEATAASLDPERFAVAVERLSKAARIVLLGVGISGNVGFVVQQNFIRTGIPTAWTNDPNLFFTHLAPLSKGDVCLALSQTGSQKDTLDGIRFARQRGLEVISITSDPRSPIATEAGVLLLTGPAPVEAHTYLSIGAQLALPVLMVADALAVAVGARNHDAFLERSQATAEAMKSRTIRS